MVIRLFIATPCYGPVCHLNYIHSLLGTVQLLGAEGVEYEICFTPGDSLVPRARNTLVARFLSNARNTHLMFIDSDISWNPRDLLKLLGHDKDVIGGVYPKKGYNWDRLAEAPALLLRKRKSALHEGISDITFIKHNLLDYNINLLPEERRMSKGCMKVRHVATGFLMIKRHVLEKLAQEFADTKYTDDCGFLDNEDSEHLYALFDCAVVDGHYLSEDWLFCHRCSQLGIDIFAELTIELAHAGSHVFEGRPLSLSHPAR